MKPASSMGDLRRDFDGDDTVVGGLDPWVLRGLVESSEIKVCKAEYQSEYLVLFFVVLHMQVVSFCFQRISSVF